MFSSKSQVHVAATSCFLLFVVVAMAQGTCTSPCIKDTSPCQFPDSCDTTCAAHCGASTVNACIACAQSNCTDVTESNVRCVYAATLGSTCTCQSDMLCNTTTQENLAMGGVCSENPLNSLFSDLASTLVPILVVLAICCLCSLIGVVSVCFLGAKGTARLCFRPKQDGAEDGKAAASVDTKQHQQGVKSLPDVEAVPLDVLHPYEDELPPAASKAQVRKRPSTGSKTSRSKGRVQAGSISSKHSVTSRTRSRKSNTREPRATRRRSGSGNTGEKG